MSKENKPPLVSVIMSAYNNQSTILDAVNSMLNQTYSNIEIIIVDDCSTDNTLKILEDISSRHEKIKLLRNFSNLGLAASLNKAIKNSKGQYFARMDADDISMKDRIEKQISFFNDHPDIDVLGANAKLIDTNGNYIKDSNLKSEHKNIKNEIAKKNPFIHPTVVMTREFIESNNGYNEKLRKKQDYELWVRGIKNSQYYNMTDTLLKYRVGYAKSFNTDLYGFYVRLINAKRGGYIISGLFWAVIVLITNVARKFGYIQKFLR